MKRVEIDINEWRKAIERAISSAPEKCGLTCRELSDMTGQPTRKMREILRILIDKGLVEPCRVWKRDISMRVNVVPAYKLKRAKK